MTVETFTEQKTQEAAFVEYNTSSKWQEIDYNKSLSTTLSSDMSATVLSPSTSRSSSSSTLNHLSRYIDENQRDNSSTSTSIDDRSTIERLQLQVERQQREIAALKLCIAVTNQNWQDQVKRADEAVKAQQQAESEIEQLSTQLFEQANEMVAKERRELYAANEHTDKIMQKLERTQELLNREQSLRSRITGSSANTLMMDTQGLALFRDFIQRIRTVSLDHINRLPLMKQCLDQDINPCLQGMKKLSSRKLLNSLIRRPCMIEQISADDMSVATIPCYACGAPQRPNEHSFRFRMNDSDRYWHRIDQRCRDRLSAVSTLYEFIRHLHIGLQGQQRSLESLYHEMVWLRLCLFWARSGIMIDSDTSAESMVVSISQLFNAQSHLL